jgi:hypothetical protein
MTSQLVPLSKGLFKAGNRSIYHNVIDIFIDIITYITIDSSILSCCTRYVQTRAEGKRFTLLHMFTLMYRRSDVKKHLSVPFRNAIFRGIIATEGCCFAQLLKVVHSVSDRCFFARLRKALRYNGNVGCMSDDQFNSCVSRNY